MSDPDRPAIAMIRKCECGEPDDVGLIEMFGTCRKCLQVHLILQTTAREQAERERDEAREVIEMVHPRVFKLAAKGEFICIGEHEPYFMRAYAMIREHEMGQGTWTEEDRVRYAAAQLRRGE